MIIQSFNNSIHSTPSGLYIVPVPPTVTLSVLAPPFTPCVSEPIVDVQRDRILTSATIATQPPTSTYPIITKPFLISGCSAAAYCD